MLNNAGVELEVIDEVVFYESSYVKKGRVLTTSFWRCPRGVSQFVSASTVFTSYLGFQKNSGEANTMVLAASGRASYVDDIRRILMLVSGVGV